MARISKAMGSTPYTTMHPASIDSASLAALCAARQEDTELWTEFLHRFTPKLKAFIRATLRHSVVQSVGFPDSTGLPDTGNESDLLQNTILRLVQNGCAALKRFSGTTEQELLAYLAVITRSVVRDFGRRQSAKRRFHWSAPVSPAHGESGEIPEYIGEAAVQDPVEREILAHEVERLSLQTIQDNSGEPDRDKLIFKLYFFDGLSTGQIASCKGIGLSKTGVEKILNRIKDRVRTAAGAHSIEARS